MKKLFVIVLCAALALMFAACGEKADTNEQELSVQSLGGIVQIPNPFVDCETLEEAQELADFDIFLPGSMPKGYGLTAIRAVKDTMIEIIYNNGSKEIRIRKGTGSEDISGVYNEYGETDTVTVGGVAVTIKGEGGKVNVASWFECGFAFSLTINLDGEGLSKNVASDIISTVK